MRRFGLIALALASVFVQERAIRAQGEPPRTVPDNRPPDLFPRPDDTRPAPRSGNPMAALGGLGNAIPGPGYSVSWNPARPVRNQDADLGIVRQDLSLSAPIWSEGGDRLFATASVKNMHIYSDALLPDTRRRFPKDLWNASLGLAYIHKFDNGWTGGGLISVGSASDKPFNSLREMNLSIAAFLRVPAFDDRDFWLFSLFYSPGGLLNFPIPGIAYQLNYSEQFRITIGIPFAVMWKPAPDWTFNASYIPLTNIRANLDYRYTDDLHFFGAYEFLNEAYFLSDRADRFDRFLSFEQRVFGGLKYTLFEAATLDLHAGYAFGRRFGEGRNQGSTLHDRVDIGAGAFLGAALRIKF